MPGEEGGQEWQVLAGTAYATVATGYVLRALDGEAVEWMGAVGYATLAAGEYLHDERTMRAGRAALVAFAGALLVRGEAVGAAGAMGQYFMLSGQLVPGLALLVAYYAASVRTHAKKLLTVGESVAAEALLLAGQAALGVVYARALASHLTPSASKKPSPAPASA